MMNIQDDKHILIIGIINSLLDVIHPAFIDNIHLAGFIIFKMFIPGCRDSDSIETSGLNGVKEFLSWFGIAPFCNEFSRSSCTFQSCSSNIECVSEIPADSHLRCDGLRILACQRSGFCLDCSFGQNA